MKDLADAEVKFKIDAGSRRYKIRANHGHSIQVEDFDTILMYRASDWLSRIGRNHINFITGDIDELKKSNGVLINLDIQKVLNGC